MSVSVDSLEAALRERFTDATFVKAYDISAGCGTSYEVIVVSPSFEGKPTLARHRLVNERLKDEIAQLHAFVQKTYTPKQFENVKIVEPS
ncbi:bola-like protein [Atractiella rhizophila]|nr:bola-like protein [Atractiella rhizophila]